MFFVWEEAEPVGAEFTPYADVTMWALQQSGNSTKIIAI